MTIKDPNDGMKLHPHPAVDAALAQTPTLPDTAALAVRLKAKIAEMRQSLPRIVRRDDGMNRFYGTLPECQDWIEHHDGDYRIVEAKQILSVLSALDLLGTWAEHALEHSKKCESQTRYTLNNGEPFPGICNCGLVDRIAAAEKFVGKEGK